MIENNYTTRDIEEAFNVTNSVVKRWFKDYSIDLQTGISLKHKLPPDFHEWYLTYKPTYLEIENKYKVTYPVIKRWLMELNIIHEYSSAPREMPPREELESLNDQFLGTYEIGLRYGVSQTLARKWLHNYDIPIKVTSGKSKMEEEVLEFLNMNGGNFISTKSILQNKYYQLDGYDDSLQIAFEFCGLFWHSDQQNRDAKRIHLDKYNQAKDLDIKLYTIFENEWVNKRSLVESMLLTRIGRVRHKYYARKTSLEIISNKAAREFHDINHISGSVNSSVNIGLSYDGELISVMSFSKSRFNNSIEYEITRFSTKLNSIVAGGASKIFKHFIREYDPTSVVTFADLRWGGGDVYKELGFKYDGYSPQNYFYFKLPDNTLYSRQRFQKHKLPSILDKFDSTLTERENMEMNGWRTIHDCGNSRFIWNKEKGA